MTNEKAPERIGNASEGDRVAARRLIHTLGSITGFENRVDLVFAALATARKEEREAAFKVLCSDCAEGDTPTFHAEAEWFYHYIGTDEETGCSAGKLRRAAAENRKGNDSGAAKTKVN